MGVIGPSTPAALVLGITPPCVGRTDHLAPLLGFIGERLRDRQRHPQRRRLQPAPRSRLAEDHFARHRTRTTPDLHNSASPQTGFLTGD